MNGNALGVAPLMLAAALALPASATGAAAPHGVPGIVARAAAYNATALAGVVVQQRHIRLQISAGPVHFTESNDAVVMLQNGVFSHIRYLRIVRNGKALDREQRAQQQRQDNDALAHGRLFFKQPYDAHYLHDYTFSPASCGGCLPGVRAIAFRSRLRDDQHGDGTMRIARSGRVLDVIYTPNVLPAHASTGTTTEIFASAAPGLWTIVQIDRTYAGHVAFFHGGATMVERLDGFARFSTAYAGMAYLQHAEL